MSHARLHTEHALRLSLFLPLFLCLAVLVGITLLPVASAHAAPLNPNCSGTGCSGLFPTGSGCTGTVLEPGSRDVLDSYNHVEGVIKLHHSTSCNTVWATFTSNTNTWKGVSVRLDTDNGPVQQQDYTWTPNANLDSPMQYDKGGCYFAEVILQDNRGVFNDVPTSDGFCF